MIYILYICTEISLSLSIFMPLTLLPLLVLIEFISYLARNVSLILNKL